MPEGPTLPPSFPRSTIGGIRLNFRVRNGNGCDPDPMTTGKLGCLGFSVSRRHPQAAHRARRESSQTISSKSLRQSEYSANGSFSFHDTQRFPRALCDVETIYGQASRLISIGKLNASRRLHTRPITWSSSRSLQEPYGSGDLILWRVSRLDA